TRVPTRMTSSGSSCTSRQASQADKVRFPHHHKREECRLCGSHDLECVLHLTPTPPANAFVTEAEKDKEQVAYPLDVYRCGDCRHLQLLDIVDPKTVCAYNVCAHIDDLRGVIEGVRALLAPDGQFVLDVGYLLDVYCKTLFDTIYHEHVDFHHVGPLKRFFADCGLKLLHVERSDIQGGALVGYVGAADSGEDASVGELIALEHEAGLHRTDTYRRWGQT